jgi:peptidyl-prolyl cis-trans isomerase SurA
MRFGPVVGLLASFLTGLPSARAEGPAILRGEQLLVSFRGALRAPASVRRTKEEARRRAAELAAKANSGVDFGALVREESDEPRARLRGGSMGEVRPGVLVDELERALARMPVGTVSISPVETGFGFLVLHRLPDVPAMHLDAIVVAWKGSWKASAKTTRTKSEAQGLARQLAGKIADGGDFAEFARRHSDAPSAVDGGDLGPLRPGVLLPVLEEAAVGLAPGRVSEVVETPMGFTLLRRRP